MSTPAEALGKLRDIVLQASDPKPGRRCDGILVVSVWVLDSDPTDAVMDFFATPPEHTLAILRAIRSMPLPPQ